MGRFVYLYCSLGWDDSYAYTSCGGVQPPGIADARNHRYYVSMSMNLEIRQQQCCIVCIQFELRANKMIQDLNFAFSPEQSVLSFWSSAQLLYTVAAPRKLSPAYAAALRHPVYEDADDQLFERILNNPQHKIGSSPLKSWSRFLASDVSHKPDFRLPLLYARPP